MTQHNIHPAIAGKLHAKGWKYTDADGWRLHHVDTGTIRSTNPDDHAKWFAVDLEQFSFEHAADRTETKGTDTNVTKTAEPINESSEVPEAIVDHPDRLRADLEGQQAQHETATSIKEDLANDPSLN